ncbi:hypothetical protein DPMN_097071 [Dreissena polymorpha]|uniref:Uncharacterized protein n=1 Tax=Dreissena polymorpha TaxID=45954 RepID=A0A9D4L9W7_DREPO|nr:hypothetical protein DPMN_097071 [Dreissena polymorpha]
MFEFHYLPVVTCLFIHMDIFSPASCSEMLAAMATTDSSWSSGNSKAISGGTLQWQYLGITI